jgi:phosphoenolpyruvate carboxylase
VQTALPTKLRHMVHDTVELLGEVLKDKLGNKAYQRIEQTRQKMAHLRTSAQAREIHTLQIHLKLLEKLTSQEQFEFAQSFALMLELMNTCENAFRSHEIKKRVFKKIKCKPESIIYVLTAHPTEARSPHNIRVFQEILKILTRAFERSDPKLLDTEKQLIYHWIEVAWSTSMVRTKKPRVHDEAEHIYLTLLREETLSPLLRAHNELAPIFVRSWVGGDKDGHPGVDEKVFLESLQLSRHLIIQFLQRRLNSILDVIRGLQNQVLLTQITETRHKLKTVAKTRKSDGKRIKDFKNSVILLSQLYLDDVGSLHPDLIEIKQLIEMFPGLVVPLEFRESSDILVSSPTGKGLAIFRMLKTLANISKGGDPRCYVRELIISMAENITHIRIAAGLVQKALGQIYIPIVPLFEQAKAQDQSVSIVQEMLNDKKISRAIHTYWKSHLEIMLGYSDSSKESGVLPSRLKVAETMYALEDFCKRKKIKPIFFQGSGGSVDRGGGSIEEQTSWWSSSALRNYKVTIQGEMVERNLANAEITRGQLEQIAYYAGHWKNAEKRKLPKSLVVDNFADKVATHYQDKIKS